MRIAKNTGARLSLATCLVPAFAKLIPQSFIIDALKDEVDEEKRTSLISDSNDQLPYVLDKDIKYLYIKKPDCTKIHVRNLVGDVLDKVSTDTQLAKVHAICVETVDDKSDDIMMTFLDPIVLNSLLNDEKVPDHVKDNIKKYQDSTRKLEKIQEAYMENQKRVAKFKKEIDELEEQKTKLDKSINDLDATIERLENGNE